MNEKYIKDLNLPYLNMLNLRLEKKKNYNGHLIFGEQNRKVNVIT